jgi:hypothetical protein
MQSIEILIVIVLIQYHAPALLGQAAARCGPSTSQVYAFQNDGVQKRIAADDKEKAALRRLNTTLHRFHLSPQKRRLLVVFGFQDFTTTIEAVRADVVTQVGFTGGWLDAQLWSNQEIVRTVHTALRRGLLVLLNCHVNDS